MPRRGELETLAASLEELLARVTGLVEREGATASRDASVDLVAIERGLASTLRRLQRLTAKSRP